MPAPRVVKSEVDLSTIVRGGSTSVGALVGYALKGRVDERVLVTSSKEFVEEFGEPVPGNYFHYTALAFLEDSKALYVVRVHNGALYSGATFKDSGATEANAAWLSGESNPTAYSFVGDDAFIVYARGPGVDGDSIKVTVTDVDVADHTFVITVYYLNSDTAVYEEVEEWTVSRKTLQKDGYGVSQYLEDVINDVSKYIKVTDNTDLDEDNSPKEQATALQLAGGDDGSAVTSTQVNTGWDLFADKNAVTVNILLAGGWTAASTVSKIVDDVAAVRGDCTAKIDTPYYVSQSSDAIAWAATLSVSNPSYYTAYYPWLKVTDEYNDKTVIVPPSGYTAGVRARTNKVANVWSAAYGLNRGVINAVAPVVYIDETNQDLLYDAQINPIIRVPGVGVVVWGQRTGQAKESALSGENVRCLLNYWETAIEATLQYYLGEENTEFTRTQVKQACDNFTDPLVAKGAFYDAQIVCDETNNTSTTIDAGELHVDGYVQPVKIADRIPFKIVITRTGVNLQELASSAVV